MSISEPLLSAGKTKKMTRYLAWVCLLLGGLLIGIGYPTPARADDENIQIEVVPDEIEVFPGRENEIQVTLRNLRDSKIQNTRLSYFTEADIQVEIQAPESTELEPHSALTWVVKVSPAGDEQVSGSVHLRIDYSWQPEGSEDWFPGVAHHSLEVKNQIPDAIQVNPEIQVKTALTNLVQGHPGIVYVVIKNGSTLPIRVSGIQPDGPDFIQFSPTTQDLDERIEPNDSQVFRYTVETDESVTPGKYLLLFEVDFTWELMGHQWPGTAVETHEIDVSVFGESGIMSALGLATAGIPTFLILPGFLIIATIGVCWRWFTPKAGDYAFKNLGESLKKLEFWFWAFTLSLLMIPVYRFGTGYLGTPRDLLKGYSFDDIGAVWFASIVLAVVGFVLYATLKSGVPRLLKSLQRVYQDWQRKQVIPSINDSQIEILEKLDRQDLGVWRERVVVSVQGKKVETPVFLLQPLEEGKEEYWVSPRIKVQWKSNRSEEEELIFTAAQKQLNKSGDDAGVLAAKLTKARQRQIIQLTWEPTEPVILNGPSLVKAANLQLPPMAAVAIATMEQLVE